MNLTQSEISIFSPPGNLSVSESAEKHRTVLIGSAKGKWENSKTPYLTEIMDAWTLPHITKYFLLFAPQTGKTQWALNTIHWTIMNAPDPLMYVMPNEKVGKRLFKNQLIPMIKTNPALAELLIESKRDQSIDRISFKHGMEIMLAWAGAPASLASESVRYGYIDEACKNPEFSGNETSPFPLVEERTNVFTHNKKLAYFSTPAKEGHEFTEKIKEEADEFRRLFVSCPKCDFSHVMDDENLWWPESKSIKDIIRGRLARYICPSCGLKWSDLSRDRAVSRCEWRADKPVDRPYAVAWHLPAMNSPFKELSECAAAKMRSGKSYSKLFTYVTQYRAEAFREVVTELTEKSILDHKTDTPPLVCPEAVELITCGADPQQTGYWYVVRGWAEDKTSWLLDYGFAPCKDDMDRIVHDSVYTRITGETLKIWRAASDTGGRKKEGEIVSRTEEIYQFIRKHLHKKILHAIKGTGRAQAANVRVSNLDKLPSGKKIRGGMQLRTLDVNALKDVVHWRMSLDKGDEQYMYLHSKVGNDYVKHMMAEQKIQNKDGKTEWVQKSKRNDLFDCEVYAAACVDDTWIPSFKQVVQWKRKKGI